MILAIMLLGLIVVAANASSRSAQADANLRQAVAVDEAMQALGRQMDADADRAARERGETPPPHIARPQ